MNAQKISDWAERNGYVKSGDTLSKSTEQASISIEFKRNSLVMMWIYPGNGMPRIRASLFKDIPIDPASGEIVLPEA